MRREDFDEGATGCLVGTISGQLAFVPNPLPPELDLRPLAMALADAVEAVGELNGIGRTLESPYLLIHPLQTKEALTSSSMEGTYSTVDELMLLEAGSEQSGSDDTREVRNYRSALAQGITSLSTLPLCMRTICDAHATLLRDLPPARGHRGRPGELKDQQNWIGARNIEQARFVPPPPMESREALYALESYIQRDDRRSVHPLIDAALIHYQFETIHPFADGNGRVGRILIPVFLVERGFLQQPLLYLSPALEHSKDAYIDLMFEVSRSGDWTRWIEFFLGAIQMSARQTIDVADALFGLRRRYRETFQTARRSALLLRLIDRLFEQPVFKIPQIEAALGITYPSAQKLVETLADEGIVEEVRGTAHPKYFAAREIMRAIDTIGRARPAERTPS